MTDEPTMPGPEHLGEHPDEELLSAYLDGSLDAADQATVERHLDACTTCGQQLEQLGLVREVMRTLPFVEPPPGFYERTLRLGPRPASTASQRFGITVVGGILGLLAVIVTLAVVSWRAEEVRPAASKLATAFTELEPAATARRSAPDGLPATLGDYSYQGHQSADGIEFEVYRRPGRTIAVTWWDAELGGLPADGGEAVAMATGGTEGWWTEREQAGVAAVERGDRVYAVVGPKGEDLMALAAALPGRDADPSLADRFRSAGRSLLEAFGFGG